MNANRLRREDQERSQLERTIEAYAGTQARVISLASVHAPMVDVKSAPAPRA